MNDDGVSLQLRLTRRALNDIQSILEYSTKEWDEAVANRYIDDIQAAFLRCSEHPGLLQTRDEFSEHLRFYVVNQHILVCDVDDNSIVVLTVSHARMDLVSKLSTLEPSLATEVNLLRQKLKSDS